MPRDNFSFHWEHPITEVKLLEALIAQDASIEAVEAALDRNKIPIRREGSKIVNPFDGETIFEPANKSASTGQLKAFVAGYLYARRNG